jgi:hypothetical protein
MWPHPANTNNKQRINRTALAGFAILHFMTSFPPCELSVVVELSSETVRRGFRLLERVGFS